ncbi:unnamed protein product [Brassica napus]|uniref:(rape) hypothetical protein n=1 Tax=Brassica napus TaxID=3708 RepID=A0A816L043_BRANA|nr:unnamed protein product [Brassica napus]
MATSQVHLLELNVVHCRETVRMRLLRFWEALNVKKAVAAFQVVCMGGVVNSTRSNRFTNGLNTTHDAAFFYSSTAGVYQEPWARHVFEQLGTCLGKLNSLRGFDPFLYKTSVRGQLEI